MITVTQNKPQYSAINNFREVLASAYECYYNEGLSNDLAAITLGKLEENDSKFDISEMINLANSLPQALNEDATNVTNPHIVQERKGKGISVTVNGKEYRYVSPDRSTEDLFKSFMGMYTRANAGYKALNYLKRNALCYYGAKNPKGKELVEAFDQGKRMILWNPASNSSELIEQLNSEVIDESVSSSTGIFTAANLDEFQKVCNLLTSAGIHYYLHESINSDAKLAETTQPSDIPPMTSDITDEPARAKHHSNINEAIDGTSVFNTQKTGMSYYDDFLNKKDHDYKKLAKGRKGEIVMMDPDEYIDRLGKDIFHCSRERVLRGVDWNNVKKYASMMAQGTKFNLPILNLADETQEGRHRALAAAQLGYKTIPVLVVTKYDPYKELSMPKSFKLWYGHTIQYTKKDGTRAEIHVGLDEEKMKAKIADIVKSGDYQ